MDIAEILARFAPGKEPERRDGALWLEEPGLDVNKMALALVEAGARFVTMTAIPVDGVECRVAYHWDLDGLLLNMIASTRQGKIPGIAGVCPAADWIEREIHDYFGVDFAGRDMAPLVLRPGDRPGIFRWGFLSKGGGSGAK